MPQTSKETLRPKAQPPQAQSGGIGRDPGTLVGVMRVKPRAQSHIALGRFTAADKLKGFSVEFKPEPDPKDSVVTEVVDFGTTGSSSLYSLVLYAVNYGYRPVSIEVRRL